MNQSSDYENENQEILLTSNNKLGNFQHFSKTNNKLLKKLHQGMVTRERIEIIQILTLMRNCLSKEY